MASTGQASKAQLGSDEEAELVGISLSRAVNVRGGETDGLAGPGVGLEQDTIAGGPRPGSGSGATASQAALAGPSSPHRVPGVIKLI